MLKRIASNPTGQAALATLIGASLGLALRTIRWSVDPETQALLRAHAGGAPVVLASWHERLALMPAVWLRLRAAAPSARVRVLVSRSRDGRLIGAVVRRFGVESAYGSSTRGGAAGLRDLARMLATGAHVGITPDGPRGPRRVAQPGVAQLAALSGALVLPCAAQTAPRIVLGTWDRMVLPRPFARGVIVAGPPIAVGRAAWREALPAIARALDEAAARADRLCGLSPEQGAGHDDDQGRHHGHVDERLDDVQHAAEHDARDPDHRQPDQDASR